MKLSQTKLFQITISLVTVALSQMACQSLAARSPAQALSVQTYTASDSGFDVNSHLIVGAHEALLVDAQFTRSEAKKVVEMVRESGRDLKTIFITHGHPDHYLGLEILTKKFPQAQVLATAEVIKDIQQTAPGKLDYWKPIYKSDLADSFVVPTAVQTDSLTLEGEKIQIVKLGAGESESAAALYIPSLQTLVSGDLAYNKVHLWLAEDRPEGWLKNLDNIQNVGPIQTVLPGHGPAGSAEILKVDAEYIKTFLALTKPGAQKETALKNLKALYPDYKLPVIADLSVSARVK